MTGDAYAAAVEELNEYEQGFLEALALYAYWKDGREYVGTTGRTLRQAQRAFLIDRGKLALADVIYPERP